MQSPDPWDDSWIEVDPQSLGFQPLPSDVAHCQDPSENAVDFQTEFDQPLLARLLRDAQDQFDHKDERSPPSPSPSREGVSERTQSNSAIMLEFPIRDPVLNLGPEEWPSHPESGIYFEKINSPLLAVPPESPEAAKDVSCWSLRNSILMKSPVFCWLLDHVPSMLSHAAAFLLGTATVFFLLRKHIRSSKMPHLPLI